MDKHKRKLNNSLSMGKSITRGRTPHSKSFFVDSAEHTLSNALKQTGSKGRNQSKELDSTPKLSSGKVSLPKELDLVGNLSRIQHNRKHITKISSSLQDSVIEKTLKINKIYLELHHFSVCIKELKWLLS